jgi:predicted nucleic acid-binding protein
LSTYLHAYKGTVSTTIRVSREDKPRLEKLAKRLNLDTMSEALGKAIELAEESDDKFRGNLPELASTLRHASSRGGQVSLKVDQELAVALEDE